MSLKPLTICLLLTLMLNTVKATTYYVRPGGNDANAGTSLDEAWASVNKVNSSDFFPGDTILFEGGSVFEGSLFFWDGPYGTAEQPIVIGSFGTGRAIINSGAAYGLKVYNTAGFRIERLVFKGAGRENNKGSGIEFYMDLPNSRLPYISIDSVDVSGYHDSGIAIGSWKGSSGFDDISITHSAVHDNGDAGISSYAEARLGHKNMYVGYNKVYNNSGLPEKTNLHSGNGIVLGGVDGALIEYCEAYNNGWLNAWKGGGPVGIWGWHCNNLVIQYNESHHNKTGTGKDGGGFDIDGGCTNCSMQYNYSHDNEGAGYLVAQYYYAPAMKGIVVRYNISENDARKNGYGAIHLWSSGSNGGIQDAEIYNNTIYLTPAAHGTPRGIYVQSGGVKNVRIYNNIIQTTGGLELLYIDRLTDLRFEGNNYWSSGSPFKIKWGGTNYSSLENWRKATEQEQRNGQELGFQLDPELSDPGKGVNFPAPGMLYRLEGYELKPGSALVGKGLNLAELGIDPGKTDFWGNNIERRSQFSVGAHQFTENLAACLYGGPIPLTFGEEAGGRYSGTGVEQESFFNPTLAGAGRHAVFYEFTDSDGATRWETRTLTVVDATETEWMGLEAQNDDWFDSRNWSTCVPTPAVDAHIPLPAEGNSEDYAVLPKIKAGEFARVQNLSAAGELVLENEATLEINGSFSAAGLLADSGSSLIFKSEDAQQIPAASYGTLLLQGKGVKTLEGNATVKKLHTEGKFYLGDYGLTIKEQGEIINSSATAYIVTDAAGSLTYEKVGAGSQAVFPVGTAASFTPATIENSGEPDDFSIRVEEGVWGAGSAEAPADLLMVNRIWHVEEKTKGGSAVTLSLQWNQAEEMEGFNRQESFVTHFENGVWSRPANKDASAPATLNEGLPPYTKSMANITSFSPFSVGSEAPVLPMEFRSFRLTKVGTDVLLAWETAGGKNSKGFDVEVSTDGQHYRTLGFVASNSTGTEELQQYSFQDTENEKLGTRYYRLKETGMDNSTRYSSVETIVFEQGRMEVSVYPNPFTDKISLKTYSVGENVLTLVINDGQGRTLVKKEINMKNGLNRHTILLGVNYPPGLYLFSARMNGESWQLKLMKK